MTRRLRFPAIAFVLCNAIFVVKRAVDTKFTLADIIIITVDALVLAVILLEWRWSYKRERLKDERAAEIGKIVAVLSDYLSKGQAIAESIPSPDGYGLISDHSAALNWDNQKDTWRNDVAKFLGSHSSRAEAAFLLIVHSSAPECLVHIPSRTPFRLQGNAKDSYQLLQAYLGNLRGVVEKPEVYF